MIIRPAQPGDFEAIGMVVGAAFGRSDEGHMVERVRTDGQMLAEFVAHSEGEIVGHVLFSRMTCDRPLLVAGLAPLAVAPGRQGRGVGSALVRRGLEACQALKAKGCVVLGAPAYYGRFGFSAAPDTIHSRFSNLAAFQALAFEPDVFASRELRLAYPPAFD